MISRLALVKLRLIMGLSAALLVVVLLESVPVLRILMQPLQQATAMLVFGAIRATGLPVAIDGILLSHPDGFRVAISYGCTPVVPVVFLASVVTLGLRLHWRQRLIALTSGIAVMTVLNLLRVAALYYIGVQSSHAFVLAHEWLGQGVTVIGTAILASYWIGASRSVHTRAAAG